MDEYLEKYRSLKLKQEEIIWLNHYKWNRISNNNTTSQQTEIQGQMTSMVNSTKHTKNLNQSLLNSSKRVRRREHSQSHSMKPPSCWYQSQRHYQKRKLQVNVFDKCRCKNPQQNISKPNTTKIKWIIHHDHVEFILESQRWFNACQVTWCPHQQKTKTSWSPQ